MDQQKILYTVSVSHTHTDLQALLNGNEKTCHCHLHQFHQQLTILGHLLNQPLVPESVALHTKQQTSFSILLSSSRYLSTMRWAVFIPALSSSSSTRNFQLVLHKVRILLDQSSHRKVVIAIVGISQVQSIALLKSDLWSAALFSVRTGSWFPSLMSSFLWEPHAKYC